MRRFIGQCGRHSPAAFLRDEGSCGVLSERLNRIMNRAIAKALPRQPLQSRADAGLNLSIYGGAAILCGISAPAACLLLLGWAALRMRARARAAGRPVLSFGGPLVRLAGVSALILGALGAAVLLAPDLPVYSAPIMTEVLPPMAE